MQSVSEVVTRANPSLLEKVKELNDKVLSNPIIKEFVEKNNLNDLQITKSMTAFHEYLNDLNKNSTYLPLLKLDEGSDYAIVTYQETGKLEEMKKKSKSLFLENNSVLGTESIKNASLDNFKIDSFEEEEAFRYGVACVRYYNRGGTGNSIMVGRPGAGKSHLSMAILKQFNTDGRTALYLSLSKTFKLIQDSWNTHSDFTEEYVKRLCKTADLLVIDDLGAEIMTKKGEHGTGWSENLIVEMLNERDDKGTIFTSNLTREQLRRRYNDRTFSRIFKDVPEGSKRLHVFESISDKRINTVT